MHEGASHVRGLGSLFTENQRLAGEVTRLQGDVRELKALAQENDALRRQLQFLQRVPRSLMACEVIARDQDGWWQAIRLNKGSKDTVQKDLAVVSVEGLVGKTVDVSENTAEVLLISDPSCKVAAQISRTGSFGILSGRGPSWRGQVICKMEFINKSIPIQAGDEVITSGLGGIFPKGLLIGYVDKVFMDHSGLYQHADIISKSDLGRLQYAFVVKGKPTGLYETAEVVK